MLQHMRDDERLVRAIVRWIEGLVQEAAVPDDIHLLDHLQVDLASRILASQQSAAVSWSTMVVRQPSRLGATVRRRRRLDDRSVARDAGEDRQVRSACPIARIRLGPPRSGCRRRSGRACKPRRPPPPRLPRSGRNGRDRGPGPRPRPGRRPIPAPAPAAPVTPSRIALLKVKVGVAMVQVPTAAASKNFQLTLAVGEVVILERGDVDLHLGDDALEIDVVLQRDNFHAVREGGKRASGIGKPTTRTPTSGSAARTLASAGAAMAKSRLWDGEPLK